MLVRVVDMPSRRAHSWRVTADVLEIKDNTGISHPCNGKVLLYLLDSDSPTLDKTTPTIERGDELLVHCTLKVPSSVDNPHQFDYRKHLLHKGISHTANLNDDNYRVIGHNKSGSMTWLADFRYRLVNIIKESRLSPVQQGLAESLLLGYRNDLDVNTQDNFRSAGITHLLCVSGLHVGIIASLIGLCLRLLGNRRPWRITRGVVQLLCIWFFVALSGMAPSAMRAGLMFSFIVVGNILYSRPPTANAVAASAVILLLIKPVLLFDIGFQLSYAAVFGIIACHGPLCSLIPIPQRRKSFKSISLRLLYGLWTLACLSLVAQLSTMPVTLYHFHQFSPYFLVANITIIPWAGILLGSIILLVTFAWQPWLFNIIGHIVSYELAFCQWVTSTISNWPHAQIENIWFDKWMLILSYGLLFALAYLLRHNALREENSIPRLQSENKTRTHRSFATATTALILGSALIIYAQQKELSYAEQRCWTLYDVGNRTALEFFAGHESYLICDSIVAAEPSRIDFQTANNRLWHQIKATHIICLDSNFHDSNIMLQTRFLAFNGQTIRIIDRSNYNNQIPFNHPLNYLLLRESPYITISQLSNQYQFDTLLIASQNSNRRRTAWKAECDGLGIPYRE